MDNNTDYQAAEILAQQDPVAFINSNPTPRDWNMTPEDINRSLRYNPHELIEAATTIETREGPEKHGFLRTLWDQTLNGIVSGMEAVGGQALAYSTAYTSPNMSREEAERILEDALYNDSLYRNAVQYERTKHVGNDFAAGLGNAIGSMITLVGVGAVTGSPALVSIVAGAQAAAEMKGQLVDEYVSTFGSTEGYAEESAKDSAIATGYGIFTGITETLLGVEKLATGAINRTTRADAYARLLRQQGKLSASKWVKTGSRLARSAIEEGAEEFVQSLAETEAASWASYTKQLSDSQELKQALTATMYGALVGGPVGMGLYRYNRKTVIDRISEWADKNKINLTAQQKVQIADDMLDNGRRQMVDEIATRAEIKNKYGQAYDLLKTRIKDLFINSTSKPWERTGQDIDQYVEDVAYTVTLPAVLLANKAHLPLSEFLDVVNLRVIRNKLHFTPLESADQLRAMLKQQEGIIREERRKAGLGIGDGARLQAAQRRKLILQDAIAEMTKADNAEHEARRRSYAQKDYIKAQELLPEQTTTIDQAQEAAENEEYVLFGQKRIPVTYEVVELDSIQPSHINGTPNPNYTNKELQNRASRGTTQDVADLRGKATNITPGRLLTSYTSSEGAPVINAQGEVIAGNGRTEIVRFAYENPETAKQYRDALENAGFSTEGMTRPILVRRNTTMTPEEQVAAADLSNISETSAFDTASRAKRDTQYLPGTTTPLEFAAKLPMSERRGLMMNNGKWNMRAVRQRYEEAVLAWVCGNDARLFEALVLDGKLTQKTISTITANAALLIETETAHPDAGIRQDLYNALVKMQNTTRQNFIEMTQQPTLTGQNPMAENMLVWNFLYTDTQTSQQYLHNYIQTIADNRNAVAQAGGLLGEPVAPLSKKDALMQALQATDEARRQASLDRGVEYKSIFTEDGQITTPELNAAVLSYKNELTGLTGTAANDQILEMLDLANEMAELDAANDEYQGDTINVDGVERTVYNSKGDRIAKSAESLTKFWRWFGNSKAVNDKGQPLVLYHGSWNKFDTFKPTQIPGLAIEKGKVFFSSNKEVASLFGTEEYPVYLKIENPQEFDLKGDPWDEDIEDTWFIKTTPDKDGVIVKNIIEAPGVNDIVSDDYIVFEPNQIKATTNKGEWSRTSNNIYEQLAFVSGSAMYERPSTLYVLRGGEGAIVHGWGIYLLADQAKNVENYRKKFSRNYVFVRNFPEIKPLNGTDSLDGKEAELFEMFKSHFKSPYNINTIADLLQDDLVPLSPEAKFFLDIQTSRQDSKYVVRKELVQGQAHTIYYTLKAPRNAHPWVKSFVKKINAIVEQRVKDGDTRHIPAIIEEVLKNDRGADFDQFLRDMFDKSETYKDYSKAFVDKAIRFINARLSSDEYGIVEVEETEPVYSPWPQLSPMDAQRVIESLQEIQTTALTDSTIRPELRAFRDAQRVILLHAILQLEAVTTPTLYAADRNLLNMLLTSDQTIDSALKDRPELSDFMRKVLKLARESREEVLKNHPNIGDMDPVEHIGSSIDFMQPEELDRYLSAIYPDITNPANPAAEFMQRTSKIMREEVAKMLKTGKLEIEYKTDNVRLFKDTDPTVIDARAPKVLQIMVRAMRNVVDKKPFDEIIYSNPETYRGLVGLLGFIDSVAVNPSVENVIRMLLIPNNTTHLGNLENLEYWKKVNSLDRTKTSHTNFLIMLLDDAKKIFDQNRTGPDNAKTDSWMALAHTIQNMEPRTKQMFQDAILDQEVGTKPEHADLIMEMILHPEWVKHTRAQQLAIEIPENDQLLDQDKPLAEQAAAPILREFITDAVPGWGLGLLEEIDQSKYPEFRKAYNLPQERLRDLIEQANDDLFNGVKNSKATKLAVTYIMQNMTGAGLWRSIADNLPEMSVLLKNGEELGEEKYDLYDPDENKTYSIMGRYYTAELARDVSMWLKDFGIQGITYYGGIDGRGFVIFSDEAMEVLQRMDDERPIYYQGSSKTPGGWYDAELDVIVMTKTMNETTFVHEMHHRYLDKIFALYKAAKAGQKTVAPEWIAEIDELFQMLEIDPNQPKLEAHQQEKFARMVEAYITGLGVEDPTNLAFKAFLNWVPERYRSVSDLAYLDKNGQIVNPMLDEQSIKFFNRWFGNPALPSLATAPDAMRMVNPTDADDKIIPSSQKEMNNREKEWGQDSEEQNKADAQLWRAIGENTPGDTRAAMDAEEVRMKAQATNMPDDRELPAKPTMRDRWFKTGQKDARTIAAEKAREYVAKNPEHARELAFTDPELGTVYDAPVDRGMLIRAVMETVQKGSDEWYLLDHNLAIVKSMSGSTLSLSGDQSHQAYLDALREVENARELKAAANYAGSTTGALETWNTDIRAFVAKRVAGIMNTQPDSEERKVAIKAFLEEARTKFSANTTGIFEQMDLTPYQTQSRQVFIKWAEKQIRKQAGAKLNTKEQAELMKASIKAQVAMTEIDNLNPDRAAQAGKDLRHWQFVKDKMKKANYGRWGKFGLFIDNMFGSYAAAAMLMSVNTLFVANIPSTAINTGIVRAAATGINKNVVSKHLQDAEKKRIKQIFKASGVNLAQMAKPTSPSTLHGEKYMNEDQKHWYNFVFEILGRTDNVFRIPTFVDALARIASKNANNDQALADKKFTEYLQLNNKDEEAQIARKQALAVANMAVFTQDGTLASALNHIRSSLNTLSRGLLGLDPNGFGLGNLLAPFLKTGANVVEMGASAAIAPIRTIAIGLKKAQGKEIPELTKLALRTNWMYFTLTAAAAALLAAITSDDDEWYTEPYQPGFRYDPEKPYDSIKLMGVWVKLDVFGPFAIPMRTAAKIIKNWEEEQFAAIASGYGFGVMEALGDTPLADQLTSNTLEYAARSPDKWAETFAYNQINKFIPAQAKTVTKAISRGMGGDIRDYTKWAGPTLQRKFHRNYGLDGQALTTNDLIMLLTNRLKIDQGQ